MLTWLLLISVIAMNIEAQSIILCDSHPTEQILADNNGNNTTHWLLTEVDNFYKSIMELYVVTSIIHCNMYCICVFVMQLIHTDTYTIIHGKR